MNMTIRGKLIVGFSIILGMLLISVLFVLDMVSDSNHRLKRIVDVSARKVNLSHEILIGVLEASRHEKNIIIEKDPIKMVYYRDRIYKAVDSVDQNTIELQSYTEVQGSETLQNFISLWTAYKSDLAQIVSLSLENNKGRAFEISISKGLTIRDSIIKTLSYLIKKSEENMQSDKEENERKYYLTFLFLFCLF